MRWPPHKDRKPAIERENSIMKNAGNIHIAFDKRGWQKLRMLNQRLKKSCIHSCVLKRELANYIAAHEAAGIYMDSQCQEICYEHGIYLILRKESGMWIIMDVIVHLKRFVYQAVTIWNQVRRGTGLVLHKMLAGWCKIYAPVLTGRLEIGIRSI